MTVLFIFGGIASGEKFGKFVKFALDAMSEGTVVVYAEGPGEIPGTTERIAAKIVEFSPTVIYVDSAYNSLKTGLCKVLKLETMTFGQFTEDLRKRKEKAKNN